MQYILNLIPSLNKTHVFSYNDWFIFIHMCMDVCIYVAICNLYILKAVGKAASVYFK